MLSGLPKVAFLNQLSHIQLSAPEIYHLWRHSWSDHLHPLHHLPVFTFQQLPGLSQLPFAYTLFPSSPTQPSWWSFECQARGDSFMRWTSPIMPYPVMPGNCTHHLHSVCGSLHQNSTTQRFFPHWLASGVPTTMPPMRNSTQHPFWPSSKHGKLWQIWTCLAYHSRNH